MSGFEFEYDENKKRIFLENLSMHPYLQNGKVEL